MVVDLYAGNESTSRLFHALADATRRDIVRRSLDAEHSVSGLSRNYAISLTAVQKHVTVLEQAGLVTKHRRGREQIVSGNAHALRRAREALEQLEAVWRDRIARIDDIISEPGEGATTCP